jgi:hypothetical protein
MRSRVIVFIVLSACGGKIAPTSSNATPSDDFDPGDPKPTPNPPAPSYAHPIACGSSTCDADRFEKCCDVGSAIPTCATDCFSDAFVYACSDARSCDSGYVCCIHAHAHTATCEHACDDGAQLCATDAECLDGSGCSRPSAGVCR